MLKVGQQLSDSDHIVRYVPPSRLARDGDDRVTGFLFSAFQLREGEPSLSVSRLEHFTGDRQQQITDCVRLNRKCIVVRPSSAFAVGKVGVLKAVGQQQPSGRAIKVVHAPSKCNSSHALVEKLDRDEIDFLDKLGTDVFTELVLNTSIPD